MHDIEPDTRPLKHVKEPYSRRPAVCLSVVEGRGFHVEGEGAMSRVEGNIFFSNFFFFFGKGNNRCNQCH